MGMAAISATKAIQPKSRLKVNMASAINREYTKRHKPLKRARARFTDYSPQRRLVPRASMVLVLTTKSLPGGQGPKLQRDRASIGSLFYIFKAPDAKPSTNSLLVKANRMIIGIEAIV